VYYGHPARPSSQARDPISCGLAIPSGGSGILDTSSALSRRHASEVCISFTLPEKEGRRESRVPIAPAVVHKKRTSRPQVNRIIRLSLRDGLRLIRAHPGDRAFLPPSSCGLTMSRKPGRARHISAKFDASVGASGLHDFAVRACPAKALAGPRTHPASFVENSLAAPFVRAPDDRSRSSIRPAIPCAPDAVASIASHRAFVTCATPLVG
jgi:hypothetical protein